MAQGRYYDRDAATMTPVLQWLLGDCASMDTKEDRMPPPPPISPFPKKSDIKLSLPGGSPDARKLNDAVTHAVPAEFVSAKFAISIVDPVHSYAVGGLNGDHEYYTGSLVKVGVLYGAYALFDMVKRYKEQRAPKSADELFKGLRTDMDDAIVRNSHLVFSGSGPAQRAPSYESVFSISNSLDIDFRSSFKHNLEEAIVHSDNRAAGQCIHGLGYSYINGALEQGGFFDSGTKKGVWAAGDFKQGWAPIRIPCENLDVGTAQGATTDDMTRLLAVMVLGDVVKSEMHFEMSQVLQRAAIGKDPSFLSRPSVPGHLNKGQVTHAKIGIGEDPDVLSEGELVKGIGRADGVYFVAWQNVANSIDNLTKVIAIIKNAITAYET